MPKGRRTHHKTQSGRNAVRKGSKDVAYVQKGPRGGTFFTVNPGDMSMVDLLHTSLLTSASPLMRQGKQRLRKQDRILLVGEGDFSFTEALSTSLGYPLENSGQGCIVATSYDAQHELSKLHPTAPERLQKLKSKGVKLLHRIDATKMSTDSRLSNLAPFSRVVFNFPHVGGGSSQEDVKVNREMLKGFFGQARILIQSASADAAGKKRKRKGGESKDSKEDGQIHVALRSTPFYQQFRLVELAESVGLKLLVKEPFEFERWGALGYIPQRTTPAVRAAPTMEDSELYVFEIDSDFSGTIIEGGDGEGAVDAEEVEEDGEEQRNNILLPKGKKTAQRTPVPKVMKTSLKKARAAGSKLKTKPRGTSGFKVQPKKK
ncbi:hypothetical protein HDU97_001376 [Phlyctochytrium planicorne]|nr:hypothetical protein HDU97_001376 [Phlyctochytrium planicorne]